MRISQEPLRIERENGVSQLPPRAMIAAAMVLASAFSLQITSEVNATIFVHDPKPSA